MQETVQATEKVIAAEGTRLLHMEKIVKRFHGQAVLKGIDFDLFAGEIVALCGTNGAGKSTLSNIIMGIYTKDEGEIFINDKRVDFSTPKDAERSGIGMVHQEPTLAKNMTVYENIFLNNEIMHGFVLDKKKMIAESSRILNFIGFDINPLEKVANLTLVQREVVEIAKAMLFDPKVLILDEVTAPLNLKETEHLFSIIKDLKTRGIGIIFIGHKIKEITQIADRVVVIRDGNVVGNLDNTNTRVSEREIIQLMLNEQEGWQNEYHDNDRGDEISEDVLLALKDYSAAGAFQDVNIDLHKGEIIGFAGLKGSGVTELMRSIYGAYPHDSGYIIKDGKKISPVTPKQAIKNGIGMVTNDRQVENIAMTQSVLDNMMVSSLENYLTKLGNVDVIKERKDCNEQISKMDIKTTGGSQLIQFLSGGNQQKVVVAKWIIRNMDILMFDEPTRGVDVKAKNEIYELLISQKKYGKGVLVYSPEIRELLNVADRIIIFAHGTVKCSVGSDDPRFTESGILELVHTAH